MKKFRSVLIGIVLLIMILPLVFVNTSAKDATLPVSKFNVSGASISGGRVTLPLSSNPITLTADISEDVRTLLGEYGGKLTASLSFESSFAPDSDGKVTYTTQFSTGNDVSVDELEGTITLTFTLTVTDEDSLQSLTISSAKLVGIPETTPPSPTATSSDEATPTASDGATPTASGEATPTASDDVTPTPSGEATPTATATATAKPTNKPSTSEKTSDPYTPDYVTQAPPTLQPEVTVDPNDIATPVPEATNDPIAQDNKQSDNSSFGLLMLFLVLLLLLAADIAVIIYRKNMGYENMVNHGISRRKMRDDLVDSPTDQSDLDQAIDTDNTDTPDDTDK